MRESRILGALACVLALLLAPRPAFAYIDPGTGNVFVQSVIAGVAAAAFTVKVFWSRIVGFFVRRNQAPDPTKNGPGQGD